MLKYSIQVKSACVGGGNYYHIGQFLFTIVDCRIAIAVNTFIRFKLEMLQIIDCFSSNVTVGSNATIECFLSCNNLNEPK